jgi:hypothetical protein
MTKKNVKGFPHRSLRWPVGKDQHAIVLISGRFDTHGYSILTDPFRVYYELLIFFKRELLIDRASSWALHRASKGRVISNEPGRAGQQTLSGGAQVADPNQRGAIEAKRRLETDDLRGEARQTTAAAFFILFFLQLA